MLNPSQHTALIPRLYDEYVEACAKPSNVHHERALKALDDMIARLQAARGIVASDRDKLALAAL